VEFLAEGVTQGQRVVYIGSGSEKQLRSELSGLPGVESLLETGAAQVFSGTSVYAISPVLDGASPVVDSEAQVGWYSRQLGWALAAGFSGLRVAADATPFVGTPEQRDAFAAYEHLLDRFMATNPLTIMCAYRSTSLSPEAIIELACMHPAVAPHAPPFRLYASADGDWALAGEVDLRSWELLGRSLSRTFGTRRTAEMTVDASSLEFIDAGGLKMLDGYARRRGSVLVLRGARRGPARLIDLMKLPGIRAEP
jgi:anti-anti-sigma regulatory factor